MRKRGNKEDMRGKKKEENIMHKRYKKVKRKGYMKKIKKKEEG